MNWLLFPVLQALSGSAVLFLNLACLFLFAFVAIRRYTADTAYALVFAALWIQASAWVHQLFWPFVTLASAAMLMAAACTVRRLPIYTFYALFGVLMWGALQHLYFLLPLLHLPHLAGSSFRANARVMAKHIVPAWVVGYLFGAMVSLLAVWGVTSLEVGAGQIGLEIADWRSPNPVDSWIVLVDNTIRMIEHLVKHVKKLHGGWEALSWFWSIGGIAALAVVLGLPGGVRHIPAKVLFVLIAISIYVTFIFLLGTFMQYRTGGPLVAAGLAALLFLPHQTVRWRQTLQLGLMFCLSLVWGAQSWRLLDRTALADTYRTELLRAAPRAPELFEGVIFMNGDRSIAESSEAVMTRLGGSWTGTKGPFGIRGTLTLRPTALAAGFSRVLGCGSHDAALSICVEVNERFAGVPVATGTSEAPPPPAAGAHYRTG